MYPPQAPWSGLGQLEGEIQRLKSDLHRKAEQHEITEIHRRLDGLECTMREISSEVTRLWDEVRQVQDCQSQLDAQ